MVRKVRKFNLKALEKDVESLRKKADTLINVHNAEWYSLFKDEIRNSIAIEGVFTNRQDLIDVLENNKRTNKQKAAAILGYFEAASTMYEYANNQFKENEFVLRLADVKQIHTILMRYEKEAGAYIGKLGEFRATTAEVAQSHFMPISHFYIRESMILMVKWINAHLKKNVYDAVSLAALAHVWFETIHPFRDGNGRAGRILLSYILVGCGLVNIAIKGLSEVSRDKYYHSLEECDGVFDEINRKIESQRVVSIKDVDRAIQNYSYDAIATMVYERLRETARRLKEGKQLSLNAEAILPLKDLAKAYDYSQDYLRNLINRGHLKAQKKGKLWYVKVKNMADYVNSLSNK